MRTILIAPLITLATQAGAKEITAGKLLKHYDGNDPIASNLAQEYLNGMANSMANFIAYAKMKDKSLMCPPSQIYLNSEVLVDYLRLQVAADQQHAKHPASAVILRSFLALFPCLD